jgi:hypothetical protein
MTVEGGLTDHYRAEDGRLKMAQALVDLHPELVTITEKWGRPQHQVDYSPFRGTKLVRKPGARTSPGVDDFGMVLEQLVDGEWRRRDTASIGAWEAEGGE